MSEDLNEDANRAAIYAAMMDAEEDEVERKRSKNPLFQQSDAARTVTIPLADGQSVEVPSMAYVRELERLIRAQATLLDKFERQFHRVEHKLRTHRSAINGHNSRINDVGRELDQKIDRRD